MRIDGCSKSDHRIKTYTARKRNITARLDSFGIGNVEIKIDNGINQCVIKLSMDEVATLKEVLCMHIEDEYLEVKNETK